MVELSDAAIQRIKNVVKQRYWTECLGEHSELRINYVKAFCKHLGLEFRDPKYQWQNEFITRWFVAPWSQPLVTWSTLLESLERMSHGERGSGRTTMLALFLAVEEPIELKPYHMLLEFPDHHPTAYMADEMHGQAHLIRRKWYRYIGKEP